MRHRPPTPPTTPIRRPDHRPTPASGLAAVAGLALLIMGLAGCTSSTDPAASAQARTTTIDYPADAGPGEVGDRVAPADLGVTSSDPEASATKVGRRTYRLADEGGVTTFVLPPTRYRDADEAAVAAVASQPVTATDCAAVASTFAAAVGDSITPLTGAALNDLPVEDRHYAVIETLLVPIERTRVDASALGCDLTQLASDALARLDDDVRSVLLRSLTPLDTSSGAAQERDTTITATDVGQLLAPVTR